MYNPIDLQEIEQLQRSIRSSDVDAYKRSLGMESDDFIIGRFGRDDIVKWSDMLIDAFRTLMRRGEAVKLLVQTAPASRIDRMRREFGKNVVIPPETSSASDLALF